MEQIANFFQDMNLEKAIWIVAFCWGLFFLIVGFLYWITRKHKKESHYAIAAVIEFMACWIMYMPNELYCEDCSPNKFLRVVEAIVTAFLKSLNVSTGNDYERTLFEGHLMFSSAYAIVRIVANLLVLMFLGGFILKFIEGPLSKLKISSFIKGNAYVFTECNQKTISIAQSISEEINGRKRIIFACEFNDDMNAFKDEIATIGGILIEESPSNVIRSVKKHGTNVEVFLFCNSEENSLIQLEEISSSLEKHDGCEIKIFVELIDTPWNLYNGFAKRHGFDVTEKVLINFVRTEENFIYNYLATTSIFEHAKQVKDYKAIKMLIVGGLNDRNLELIKTSLFLGQMPGYKLEITILDDKTGKAKLLQKIPELKDEMDVFGDAIYKIDYVEKVDFDTLALEETITKKVADFTFAFINVSSDLYNAEIALRINALCIRNKRPDNSYTIQTNIYNQSVCSSWNEEVLMNIRTVGDNRKTYSYSFLTMSAIETASRAIHEVRQENKVAAKRAKGIESKPQSWASYCNNEYERHSVYARTLSFKYKIALIESSYNSDYSIVSGSTESKEVDYWRSYEHMRWNMYTRGLGYVYCNPNSLLPEYRVTNNGDWKDDQGNMHEEKEYVTISKSKGKDARTCGRIHQDLVGFEDLPKVVQIYDGLDLTPEIVQIFHEMDKTLRK